MGRVSYRAKTCMKCGALLPAGWQNSRCANCFNELRKIKWERMKKSGLDILNTDLPLRAVPPPAPEPEEEPELFSGKRVAEYMEADDLNTEGVIALMEELFKNLRKEIWEAYKNWIKSAMANEGCRVIYNAELNYESKAKAVLSPLWIAGSGSDPDEYLAIIWQEVKASLFRGNKVVERYIKNRMRDARAEAKRKIEEAQRKKK